MACIDIYPEDYLPEIDTMTLVRELAERTDKPKSPHWTHDEEDREALRDALLEAWESRDEAAFLSLLDRIDPDVNQAIRDAKRQVEYEALIAVQRAQAIAPAAVDGRIPSGVTFAEPPSA